MKDHFRQSAIVLDDSSFRNDEAEFKRLLLSLPDDVECCMVCRKNDLSQHFGLCYECLERERTRHIYPRKCVSCGGVQSKVNPEGICWNCVCDTNEEANEARPGAAKRRSERIKSAPQSWRRKPLPDLERL